MVEKEPIDQPESAPLPQDKLPQNDNEEDETLKQEEPKGKGGKVEIKKEKLVVQEKSLANLERQGENEDAIFSDPEKNIYAVFDGMGGKAGGEVASQMAKKYLAEHSSELEKNSWQEVESVVKEILINISQEIRRQAEENPGFSGMGTTASLVKIMETGNFRKVVVGNVGDSRVYILDSEGKLVQETLDDNWLFIKQKEQKSLDSAKELQEELNSAKNPKSLAKKKGLEYYRHEISQYLGKGSIEPNIYTFNIFKNERVVIMSDGISDIFTTKEIENILRKGGNMAEKLVTVAFRRGKSKHPRAKRDDMSVIII